MSQSQKGTIAGLALGSFISMLLVLFACITMPFAATMLAPLAAFGVFLGAFSGCLVTMTWATSQHFTTHALVTEFA